MQIAGEMLELNENLFLNLRLKINLFYFILFLKLRTEIDFWIGCEILILCWDYEYDNMDLSFGGINT